MRKITVLFTALILSMLFAFPVLATDAPTVSFSTPASQSVSFVYQNGSNNAYYSTPEYVNASNKLVGSGFDASHLYFVETSFKFKFSPSSTSQSVMDALTIRLTDLDPTPFYAVRTATGSNVLIQLGFYIYDMTEFSTSVAVAPHVTLSAGGSLRGTFGFSDFSCTITDKGASVDNEVLIKEYEKGFSAGETSGYESGYSSGYASGEIAGKDAANQNFAKWGYDSTEYPALVGSYDWGSFDTVVSAQFGGVNSIIDMIGDFTLYTNFDINPLHIYKYVFKVTAGTPAPSSSSLKIGYTSFEFTSGDSSLLTLSSISSLGTSISSFANGNQISNALNLRSIVHGAGVTKAGSYSVEIPIKSLTLSVYDMGYADGQQNLTAKQTEDLTQGYDSSAGTIVKDNLQSELDPADESADSLFSDAHTGLDNFTFFDFNSVPAVVTGLSFVSTMLVSIYTSLGGLSGVGIVLSCLFTILIISLLIGLYRYYKR